MFVCASYVHPVFPVTSQLWLVEANCLSNKSFLCVLLDGVADPITCSVRIVLQAQHTHSHTLYGSVGHPEYRYGRPTVLRPSLLASYVAGAWNGLKLVLLNVPFLQMLSYRTPGPLLCGLSNSFKNDMHSSDAYN